MSSERETGTANQDLWKSPVLVDGLRGLHTRDIEGSTEGIRRKKLIAGCAIATRRDETLSEEQRGFYRAKREDEGVEGEKKRGLFGTIIKSLHSYSSLSLIRSLTESPRRRARSIKAWPRRGAEKARVGVGVPQHVEKGNYYE